MWRQDGALDRGSAVSRRHEGAHSVAGSPSRPGRVGPCLTGSSGDPGASCLWSSTIVSAFPCARGPGGHHTEMSFQAAGWRRDEAEGRGKGPCPRRMGPRVCTRRHFQILGKWPLLVLFWGAMRSARNWGFYSGEKGEWILEDNCRSRTQRNPVSRRGARGPSCAPQNVRGSVSWGQGKKGTRH